MSKPSIPQGTRDFGPDVVRKRNYILNIIRNVFELYGFQPLETPAMENLETLVGKYGEEGDKLIFRILDSGNPFSTDFNQTFIEVLKGLQKASKHYNEQVLEFSKKFNLGIDKGPYDLPFYLINPEVIKHFSKELLENKELRDKYLPKLKDEVSEKALKYDLTIPFARYVAMNHNQLTFPFKRYQIQPVWRADRPQKGRYREFYQCDADVVGSNSLLNEIELANIYHDVFTRLGIKNYELRINHRKILTALAELCGGADKMNSIAISIDKLENIGLEKVKEELKEKEFKEKQISIIEEYLSIVGANDEKINKLERLIGSTESGKKELNK